MFARHTRIWTTIACLGLMLGVAACSKKTTETSNPGADQTAVIPTTVSAVELGRGVDTDKRITERVEQFRPGDTIYASVITAGTTPATLHAKWTYQDGQVVEESDQSISPAGTSATEFHVSKPDGWPAGNYTLEISLNGAVVQTKQFTVGS